MQHITFPVKNIRQSPVELIFDAQNKVPIGNKFFIESLDTAWLKNFLEEKDLLNIEKNNIYINIKLTHEYELIRAKFYVKFSPLLECVRCAENFSEEIEFETSAFYLNNHSKISSMQGNFNVKNVKPSSTHEIQLTADDLELYQYNGLDLIMDEFILDSLFMALPDYPICKCCSER